MVTDITDIKVQATVPSLSGGDTQDDAVKQCLTLAMIAEGYPQEAWIHVFTDGSATSEVINGGAGILVHFPQGQKATAKARLLESTALTTMQKQKPSCRLHPLCRLQIMTASRLSSFLTPSLSCRDIKTTGSQHWPKPYSKLQLPGGLFCSGFQSTVEYQERNKQTSLQRKVPEENSITRMSASGKRRLSSVRSWCHGHRGMTITCCPGSSKSFWQGFVLDKPDWTVICATNWIWHPHQPASVVKKTKPQSMFYKDALFTKLQEKMCGLSALLWQPNSTATCRSWRRRLHSSPKWPWLCSLWIPGRRSLTILHGKSFIIWLDIVSKLFNQYFFTSTLLMGTVDHYRFISLSMTLTLTGSHMVSWKQTLLSHTFQLISLEFDMVLKRFKFNNLLLPLRESFYNQGK